MYTKSKGQPLLKPKKKTKKRKQPIPKELYEEILERDNYVCQVCGSNYWLECHHIIYRSQGGKHEKENLVMLCKECHNKCHSNKRKWLPKLKEIIRKKYENVV